MRRWFLGSISGILTAVTVAAAAFAAVGLRGPSSADLMRDLAVVDRELALAERTLLSYRDYPPIAKQIELRIAILQTTQAMLDQKRLSWLRGLKLIYRVDGTEVTPNRNVMLDLQAKLADAEAGMLTARKWAARSTNPVTKSMAQALEQVHLLTHAAVRQQMALESLGLALPPPALPAEKGPAPAGVVGALDRPASVR
ncbi:MAG: hypothetical protein ACRED5_10405 [Propylenella sp.]